jgi:AcrR family transcriptional regulator
MPTPPKPSRKATDAYHHGDLREALVQAAMAQVERHGPEAISLSALAKTLGVSQPAPYRHFADREALLVAVAAQGFRLFSADLKAAAAAPSAETALLRMARAYVAFGGGHGGLYRLMFASRVMPNAPADSELHVASQESLDLLLGALEPSPVPLARERRALGIWAGLHGVVMLMDQGLLLGAVAGVPLDDLVEDIVARND